MISQLHRRTAPSARADAAGAATPVVSVFGPLSVAGLDRHLAPGWTVRRPAAFADVGADDIVLITDASPSVVRTARAVLPPDASVVALVPAAADAGAVAEVLTAGAGVCVRAGRPAVLAAHLVACRRRQVAARWATLRLPSD